MTRSTRPRLITGPFVVVTVATLAFFVFVGIAVSVLPRFIENELGGDGLAIGVNLAVFSVAAIAARPAIARIGDRFGRRTLMIGGSLLAAVAVAGTAFVSSIATLLPLRALSGVGEAALFVGAATLIADLSPTDRRAEGASYFSLAVFGGLGLGPVIGEVVLGDGRYQAVFLVAALACLTAAAISLFAPNRVAGVAVAPPEEARRGLHRAAVLPGLVLACGVGAFAAFNAFLPTHAEDLGMRVSGPFVVYSALCLLIRLFGARLPERMGLGLAVTQALTGLAIGLLLLSVLDSPRGVYLGTVVLSMGTALLYPSLMAFAVNSVSAVDRARVLATFTMFFEVGTVAGGLVLGPVARFFGDQGAFAGGAVMALTGIWVLRRRLLPSAQARQTFARPAPAPLLQGGLAAGE